MTRSSPLTIGAALPVEALAQHRDWLFDRDRDVELQTFHFVENLDSDWSPLAEEARRQLDGHTGRIGIHGPFWGFSIDSVDPQIRAVITARLMQGLEICAAVNATQMVVHSPFTPWQTNNLPMYADGMDRLLANVQATLDPVVKRAEDQGVTLVIENVADNDAHQRNTLIDSFASPAVRASVDTGHAHLSHCTQNAQPVDYFIRIAGARLAHVHLQDVDGHADRHWRIGEGSIPWHAVFRALAALKQKPHIVLEMRDPAMIQPSMAWLTREGLAE